MPYRPPPKSPPKPKKHKQAPSPEDNRPGIPKPPPKPPKPPPSPEDVHTGQHAAPHPVPAWITRRQRQLRAAGYHIRVDGIWGARSQHYWDAYKRNQVPRPLPVFKPPPPPRIPNLGRLTPVPEITAGLTHRTQAHAQRVLQTPDGRASGGTIAAEQRDYAAGLQRAAIQEDIRRTKAVAARARQKPPLKMTLEDLVALSIDPVTHDFNPRNPGDAKRVQVWLKAHGHPRLNVDGVWSRETFTALQTSYFAAQADEAKKRAQHVSDQFYKTGALKPNQNIPGLGLIHGPGDLVKHLTENTFGSAIAWRWVNQQLRDQPSIFKAWRDKELLRLEWQGATKPGGVLPVSPLITNNLDRYLRIAANLQQGQGGKEIGALVGSNSWKELQAGLRRIRLMDEAERRHEMAASQHHPWWLGALDAINKPVDYVKHTGYIVGATAADLYELGAHPQRAPRGSGWTSGLPTYNVDQQAEAWDEWLKREHPWIDLGYSIAADPLNFVFPIGIAKGLVRGGTETVLRLEKIGYGLDRAGSLSRYGSFKLLSKSSLALTTPARTGRILKTGIGTEWDALKATKPGQFIAYSTEKATRLKQETLSVARTRATMAMRHGFAPKALRTSEQEFQSIIKGSKSTRASVALDAKLRPHIVTKQSNVIQAMEKNGLSLFADDVRSEHSGVGAALLARMAEVFRVNEVKRYAAAKAHDVYENTLAGQKGNQAAAEAAARKVYDDLIWRGGSYIRGAYDRELAKEITPRVYRALDKYEHTFFRGIQDELEQRAEAKGLSLFAEDTGKWVGRESAQRQVLRSLGAEAFNPNRLRPVINSRHGDVFTIAERDEIIEWEVRGEVGRYKAWVGREIAEGRSVSQEAIDTNITKITNRAEEGWRKTASGKWEDTRPVIYVPDIYARQLQKFYGEKLENVAPGRLSAEMIDGLGALAAKPEDAFATALESELEGLAFTFGSGPFTKGVAAEFLTKLDPKILAYRPELRNDSVRKLVDESSEVLGRAYNESVPRALRQEYALMAAFAETQGAVSRNLYRGMQGAIGLWIFATLPLRFGWVVRNVIDNTTKIIIRGVHDPRIYWGESLERGKSVFDVDLRAVQRVAEIMDERFGTNAAEHFEQVIESVWQHRIEVLQKIFRLHDIEVPESVLDEMRLNPFEHGARVQRPSFARTAKNERGSLASFRDNVWSLMASKPENAAKRMLYRSTYAKAIKDGATEREAFEKAWAEVDHTLFDYSKVTVIEDNFKPILPFIQFWRKNTTFWLKTAVEKPWLTLSLVKFEDSLRDNAHADLPEWMRRYVHTDEIADGLNQVPGLGWLGNIVADADSMIDPLSFFSFSPLYRAFKDENPNLPADEAGWAFLAPMVDAMNDWGLSMNPLVRKPLEVFGVLNYRAWQSIFPQTALVQAFTRKWMSDYFGPQGLNIENMLLDPTLGRLLDKTGGELNAEAFNEYVQMEMAGQALRGEKVDRAAAEKKIRAFFFAQQVVAYFGGAYARRATPQDIQLWKMSDEFHKQTKEWNDLTDEEQRAYQLYKRRENDPVEFDRYVSMIPIMQAYYGQPSYKQKEHFKTEHPEIIPFVESAWSGKGLQGEDYVHHAQLVNETQLVMQMSDLASELKLSPEVRKFAENLFVTRELQNFWTQNDTPAETREKQIRGQWHKYIGRLTDTYFAIPEDDFDGKAGFLKQHPVLEHWWLQNNTNSDDFKAVINASNADLRESYFEMLDRKDYKSADAFLHQYPFIFEFTKAADRVTPDGDWIGNGRRGHGQHGQSQHARDYLRAQKALNHYFYLSKSVRSKFLESGTADAKMVKWYFSKYSQGHGHGKWSKQHQQDFLKIQKVMVRFFNIAKKKGFDAAWDSLGPKEAKNLEAYFRHYSHPKGNSQHAKDWIENKKYLDKYYAIPRDKRDEWLHGGTPAADKVLAYFKKWSKTHQLERAYRNNPVLKSLRPELQMRLKFWKKFYSLDPAARPGFIATDAEKYGVFVYGPIGQHKQDERLNDWLRTAYKHGLGDKQAVLLYVKPLLDYFFSLKDRGAKQLFIKANPELDYYFRNFAKQPTTKNKKLDKLIEQYFSLPEHSDQRSAFLQQHKEVQRYFDKKSTPAERAMHRMLEVYFGLFGNDRKNYGLQHPEIQAYFDKRSAERDNEKAIGEAFFQADPRYHEFFNIAQRDIVQAGNLIHEHLAGKRNKSGKVSIATRRDRSV